MRLVFLIASFFIFVAGAFAGEAVHLRDPLPDANVQSVNLSMWYKPIADPSAEFGSNNYKWISCFLQAYQRDIHESNDVLNSLLPDGIHRLESGSGWTTSLTYVLDYSFNFYYATWYLGAGKYDCIFCIEGCLFQVVSQQFFDPLDGLQYLGRVQIMRTVRFTQSGSHCDDAGPKQLSYLTSPDQITFSREATIFPDRFSDNEFEPFINKKLPLAEVGIVGERLGGSTMLDYLSVAMHVNNTGFLNHSGSSLEPVNHDFDIDTDQGGEKDYTEFVLRHDIHDPDDDGTEANEEEDPVERPPYNHVGESDEDLGKDTIDELEYRYRQAKEDEYRRLFDGSISGSVPEDVYEDSIDDPEVPEDHSSTVESKIASDTPLGRLNSFFERFGTSTATLPYFELPVNIDGIANPYLDFNYLLTDRIYIWLHFVRLLLVVIMYIFLLEWILRDMGLFSC